MAYGTRAKFEAVREIAFGSVGATYTAVGGAITDHARLVRFVNTMNDEVYISLDGTTDQLRLAAGSFLLLDVSTNKIRDDGLFIPVGTVFYVKEVGGGQTSGSVWIEVVGAEGGV